jgi:hypothetical protein
LLQKRLGVISMVLLVVLLAACSGSDEPTPTPADQTAVYFDGLSELIELRAEAGEKFKLMLGPVFPDWAPDDVQQFVLLNALREEDLSGMMQEIEKKVQALDPPSGLEKEHSLLLSKLSDQVHAAAGIATAIDDGDLPKIHLLKAELDSSLISSFSSVSPATCLAAFSNSPEQREMACQPSELPGGEYGRSIDLLTRLYVAEFGPRASFADGLSSDQLLDALTYVQPAIVANFDNAISKMQQITPPAEYADGHQVVIDYFTDLRATAFAIDQAVLERDEVAVQREFVRSGEIARSIASRMPSNYWPLVVPLFGEQ